MVSRDDVARHLDISSTYVSKLVKAGIISPPKKETGYDLEQARVAYIRSLRGSGSGNKGPKLVGENGIKEPSTYRELLDLEKWRTEKRENDIADGLVVPVSQVSVSIGLIVSEIRPLLESLHEVVRRSHPGIGTPALEAVQRAAASVSESIGSVYKKLQEGVDEI